MKSFFCIVCLFISSLGFSQEENRTMEVEDYNKDGFADTLSTFQESGSAFGGRSCSIVNGRTSEIYELGIWGSFGQIRQTLPIPPNLAKTENSAFLKRIKKELLSSQKDVADPSLQWLINANLSHSIMDESSAFDLALFPSNNWIKGTPKHPTGYYLKLNQADFNRMYYPDEEGKPKWYNEKETTGYLTYSGHANNIRLRSFDKSKVDSNGFYNVQNNDTYLVSKTAHGIIVQNEGNYKWIFVTDMNLTSGPEKLRWHSIGNIILQEHYIVFQHLLMPSHYNQFFIIDLETGVCARLKETGINFKIENNNIMIEIDDEGRYTRNDYEKREVYLTLPLQELLDELSTLERKN